MTQVTNTYDSYDTIGNREDLRDVIYNISPTETPFLNNCSVGSAKNTYHEWQTDSLAAAVDTNYNVEGDETTFDAMTPTVRRGNYTQILKKAIIIAGTTESIDRAGRDKEMSYQIAKAGKELKRDLEKTLTANQARAAGSSSTPRKMGTLGSWIATNDVFNDAGTPHGASPTGDGTNARTDSGSQTALTETNLNLAIRNAWTQGGSPNMIMVGPFNKTKITAFTGNATKYKDVQDKKVINAVDLYVSDFGELTVVPNRFQRDRDVWILDMDMFEVAYLQGRSFKTEDLAKTGDAEKKHMLAECTLVSKQEKASAGVFDCTTS